MNQMGRGLVVIHEDEGWFWGVPSTVDIIFLLFWCVPSTVDILIQ